MASIASPSTWRIKIHRMTSPLRRSSHSWKTRHLVTLSLIGFVWYSVVSKWSPVPNRSSSTLLRALHGMRPVRTPVTQNDEKHLRRVVQDEHVVEKKDKLSTPVKREKILQEKHEKSSRLLRERKSEPPIKTDGTSSQKDSRPPIILVWKAMEYQMRNYKQHLEFYFPDECGGCQVTTNRSLAKECAALVHFNSPDLRKYMDVPDPNTRNPKQIYAFWSRETPAKTHHFGKHIKNPVFDSIFNLTMNFRQDADIIDYFGNVEYELRTFKQRNRAGTWFEKAMQRKTGLALWAVSNCNSTYGATERMKYARSLIEAGLNLTAFGECFGNRYNDADMMNELLRHKFYLSFENSVHCPDYVSEKFWRSGLRAGAVPVVWGPTRSDVVNIAPVHSYIHTEDYETPEKLVEYLNYLDKNDTAYREYHAWRFQPTDDTILDEDIVPNHRSTLCRLCKKVREKPLVHKTVPSVYNWLYKTRYADSLCFK